MGSFLHIIPYKPPPLEKRDAEIHVFLTKSEGSKYKTSKFRLQATGQRGYGVVSPTTQTTPPGKVG